jgi:hypothetical protein
MQTIVVRGTALLPDYAPRDEGELVRRSEYKNRKRQRDQFDVISKDQVDRVQEARDRRQARKQPPPEQPPPPRNRREAQHQARHARAQQQQNQAKKRERRLHQRIALEQSNATGVPKLYEGLVGVAFASGPDLTAEVVEQIAPYVEEGSVVACGLNDCYRIVPYLQQFYACDEHWWKYHLNNPQPCMFPGYDPTPENGEPLVNLHVVTSQPDTMIWGNNTAVRTTSKYEQIKTVMGNGNRGFSEDPALIHWGGNSGYQLLNLMYHMGFERMILVGYNMCVPEKMGTKGHHFFGPHPKPMSQAGSYKGFAKQFNTIQGHIKKKIVNCTPRSALTAFEFGDLHEQLELARLEWKDSGDTGDGSQPDTGTAGSDSSGTVDPGQPDPGLRGESDVSSDEA